MLEPTLEDSKDSLPIEHSDGQSVTLEHGTAAEHLQQTSIKASLAKLQLDLPPKPFRSTSGGIPECTHFVKKLITCLTAQEVCDRL